ncbi:Similar to sick: Protein sickie (Drosophila melanogaster) [Cotesia congregata]|uniref:Similar to sick: Protein sickie (Drosophila melanogaster) n=1 Tax=Cotesia congregata TaxID=51543 RepID=A0A8J2HF75_COTCN|nr:Similar to sick: Protein sickie (Drosophila melanogaster) [Cotesia congregata]
MDINVCSRRVHDGYATIRRPRSRPRAVYRSDSEEFIKDVTPYALAVVSDIPQIHQVPRWSEGNSCSKRLLENYGTLRQRASDVNSQESKVFNTFAKQKPSDDRLYDSIPLESINSSESSPKKLIENFYDPVAPDSPPKVQKREKEKPKRRSQPKQIPIYAIPNPIPKPKDPKPTIDSNYVPSGDLYRTTAKYIEDINKNIAEIDKSYEEFGYTSGYGVIRTKSDVQDQENLYSLARKRNMAPMPPISPDFGEDENKLSQIVRPNSLGKLPPKLLPRSSSIDNTNRHSTGSTSTATCSTKSTESLYAISEGFNSSNNNSVINGGNFQLLNNNKVVMRSPSANRRRLLSKSFDAEAVLKDRFDCSTLDKRNIKRLSNRLPERRIKRENGCGTCQEDCSRQRRYETLPARCRKVRAVDDVTDKMEDSERDYATRSFSTVDVRNEILGNYLLDATDVILQNNLDFKENCGTLRTRHNSLEADESVAICQGFATLPRRGNTSSSSLISASSVSSAGSSTTGNNNSICNGKERDFLLARRLSGTVPVLEPLYEHAVSNPVKPRQCENVIPWWELATRKYRHRSCPSLQAHVVSAFEQSLSNMTQRLQQLTATAEKKDSELQELRDTIERLRKQSAEAGLNNGTSPSGRRHTLGDSDSGSTGCTGFSNHQGSSMARQLSADSVTSLNSLSSACSVSSHHKKKGWLRSSFSKAFSRSRKNRHGSVSDAEDCKDSAVPRIPGELSAPNSPRLPTAVKHDKNNHDNQGQKVNGQQKSPEHENALSASKSSSVLYKKDNAKEDEDVDELKKQLREKDMVLTDIRLEALSSAHQLESLKDTVIKMRNEMLNLKQNNERLQRLVTSKSLTSSQSSLPSDPERRFSLTEVVSSVAALSNGDHSSEQLEELGVPEHPIVPNTRAYPSTTSEPVIEQETDGKRIHVAVYLGSENSFNLNLLTDGISSEPPHCVIASVCISNKTTWDSLDSTVRRCFKEYVSRVDPVTTLGLGFECVSSYHLGEASRCISDSQHPELLPCGYLIGHVKTIFLVLSGYSWLAIDTLIPRSIVQRLINLLTEHRRVILCGPSGTGKSYLAGKLAHALVDSDSDGENKDAAAVATFNVDHKSSKELRQYLAHIAERCDSNAADELPRVIILENLQHAASLGELFSGLLGTRHLSCPAIIGTMSQATCSTTNLQLHHNFRWVLCANHMEPVKGFLGRYLRRKLLEHELREEGCRNAEMAAVVEWLPRVWLHLNKFLETHSSSDVTIGPRLFLSCPMQVAGSQVWFTDLWNYTVMPYLTEAVREGLTLYGRRASGNGNTDGGWEDPTQFIVSSYPWVSAHAVHGGSDNLMRLRPEEVGYDVVNSGHNPGVGASSLNMLMRLQEAANYSSPHSNDSDSVTSLDSSHTRHSEDLTSSSRGVESTL